MLIGTGIVDGTCVIGLPLGFVFKDSVSATWKSCCKVTLLFSRQIMMIAFHPRQLDIIEGGILRRNVDWNWDSGQHLCHWIAPWVCF